MPAPRMWRARATLAAATLLLLALPSAVDAQRVDPAERPSQAAAAGRSFLVPGWGQRSLGQRRGWVYAAVEAGLWVMWMDRRGKGSDLRDQYRDAAWETGRIQAGPRVDGSFSYYETMSHWQRSGAFDGDPAQPGVQPEQDRTTFNGSIWELARGIFLPPGSSESDPGYQGALDYYQQRAYGTSFLWDWSGMDNELNEYRSLIRDSDDRFRQATTALGGVLANHLLSGVDAFLSARTGTEIRVRTAPDLATGGRRWMVLFSARAF